MITKYSQIRNPEGRIRKWRQGSKSLASEKINKYFSGSELRQAGVNGTLQISILSIDTKS